MYWSKSALRSNEESTVWLVTDNQIFPATARNWSFGSNTSVFKCPEWLSKSIIYTNKVRIAMKNNQNKKKIENKWRWSETSKCTDYILICIWHWTERERESREGCMARGTNVDNDDNDYTRKMNRKIETTWALFKYCAFISIDFRVERSQDSFSPLPA